MAQMEQDAYCTLLMSDNYLPGVMVLAHSLRDNGTKKPLAVLVTLDSLQTSTIDEVKKLYDHIIPVDRIINKSPANLYLMDRLDLTSTFTKIALWRQTQFRRIVYIDADIVTLRAPDELFGLETSFAAVPDIGWPDCFNSGVMVLSPNMGDYYALLALAQRGISFDGADQGLLNMHFRNWERMSFTYNCTPSGHYQYVPAYRHFQSSINMVHYIGQDKPWTIGRESQDVGGVYEELLGRWWAVYDRHFRVPTTSSTFGPPQQDSRTVQRYVKGEMTTYDYSFSSIEPSVKEASIPEAYFNTTELPLTEKTTVAESIQKGEVTPIPTAEQRRFSAPMTDWDPIRQPPPLDSRPEASNLPTHTYTMSADRNLFQAPKVYPKPPEGPWYEMLKAPQDNDRPKPIFPWEETQSRATRVFADDKETSPEPTPSIVTDSDTQVDQMSPSTPTLPSTSELFASYSRTNAWDEMPEIGRYISGLARNRREMVQVLTNAPGSGEDPLSPSGENLPPDRRPSMKLTDFPTEFERPSLPVTPAVRRPSFWGEERDSAGELPGAEGVPKQEDWDPVAKLEELQRRQSEVLGQGPISPSRIIPARVLPESAVMLPTSEETIVPPTSVVGPPLSGGASPHGLNTTLAFQDLDFSGTHLAKSGEDEGVFSSMES